MFIQVGWGSYNSISALLLLYDTEGYLSSLLVSSSPSTKFLLNLQNTWTTSSSIRMFQWPQLKMNCFFLSLSHMSFMAIWHSYITEPPMTDMCWRQGSSILHAGLLSSSSLPSGPLTATSGHSWPTTAMWLCTNPCFVLPSWPEGLFGFCGSGLYWWCLQFGDEFSLPPKYSSFCLFWHYYVDLIMVHYNSLLIFYYSNK